MLSDALREYRAVLSQSSSAADPSSSGAAARVGGQMRVAIDVRRVSWIRKLAGDYAFNFPEIAEFYAGHPASRDDWAAAIEGAKAYARPRREMAGIIARQQDARAAAPAARDAGSRLAAPDTVAIVTGQQATMFGGPLYTLLKALTAIRLAREIAREHQAAVVPVFWVHAEDHDWDEVASCTVLDASFQPRTVSLAPPGGAGALPVTDLRLDASVEQTLAALAAALTPTDFTEWTLSSLRRAYKPGVSVSHAFALWLEALLGPYGLVVFESSDRAAKPLVADIFERELKEPGRTAALAAAAGARLAARGHQPQVEPQSDATALFHINGARTAIKRDADGFAIGDTRVSAEALIAEAGSHPEHFSPNVLLRSVVQDRLFPTIAYVPGPSELAYLGQLRDVYDRFGVPMPLLYPRASATLLDSATARFLRKYEVAVEKLQARDEAALNELLEARLPESIEQAMRDAEKTVRTSMEQLADAMPALDPTLKGAATTTLGRMSHELQALRSKIVHAAKRRDETLRRQFKRAQANVFPLGHPQERTLGIPFFLNRYGPATVDRLLEELPMELGYHVLLTI